MHYNLSQVGVSEREEIIKTPIILLRVQELKEAKWERGKIWNLSLQSSEHKPCSRLVNNTGETLLEIFHRAPMLHTTHTFLSSLPSLSDNI